MELLNFSMKRTWESDLTLILLVFWWLNEAFELHVDVNLDAKEKSYLQEHQLQLTNTCSKRLQEPHLRLHLHMTLKSDSNCGQDILESFFWLDTSLPQVKYIFFLAKTVLSCWQRLKTLFWQVFSNTSHNDYVSRQLFNVWDESACISIYTTLAGSPWTPRKVVWVIESLQCVL